MTTQTMQNEHEDMQAQNLSALIDGELSDAMAQQAIKRLDHSDAERASLSEYLAIGDAMRGLYAQPSAQPNDFTRRVMAALENEPVVLAPVRKPAERRPALWLAAATMAAITWGLWQSGPRDEINVPLAALQQPATELAAELTTELTTEAAEAQPYLAAHQDFAQAVVSAPEMRFSKAALEVRQ
ncbi:MAG: RseA family anti-sigma factor [Pseudomonadota bacterium]|nr:RseA family anti-sigma factor [Pseudomonadota bacterium]